MSVELTKQSVLGYPTLGGREGRKRQFYPENSEYLARKSLSISSLMSGWKKDWLALSSVVKALKGTIGIGG